MEQNHHTAYLRLSRLLDTDVKAKYLVYLTLFLIPFSLLLSITTSGLGISPDSVSYITAARNLAQGSGLFQCDTSPFVLFGPVYPFLLAFLYRLTTIDPYQIARFINAVCYGLIVVLSYVLAKRNVPAMTLPIVITVFLGAPLLSVSLMVWTEPLFIFLSLIFFLSLSRSSSPYPSALLAAVASLTRFAGITLIGSGFLYLLFNKRFKAALLFGISALIPFSLWLLRNWFLYGEPMGPRQPSTFTLFQNITFSANVISSWFPLLIPVFLFVLFRNREGLLGFTHYSIFFLVYTAFLIFTSTTTHFDKINDRLLSPAYIPLILMFFSWVALLKRKYLILLVIIVSLLWLSVYSFDSAVVTINSFNDRSLFETVCRMK